MATLIQTLKSCMLSSPLVFPEKIDFWEHVLLREGTGFHWDNGELVDMYGLEEAQTMNYSDLDSNLERLREYSNPISEMDAYREMEENVKRVKRQYIEKNIDLICSQQWMSTIFRDPSQLSRAQKAWIEQTENFDHALCFHFPNNLKKDWGQAIEQFFQWTEKHLDERFGLGEKGAYRKHWPENIIAFRQKIEASRERLHPLIYNGRTLQEFYDHQAKVFQTIIDRLQSGRSP